MKTIKVYIEKAEDGTYWESTENLPGGISAYGNSLDELKEIRTKITTIVNIKIINW